MYVLSVASVYLRCNSFFVLFSYFCFFVKCEVDNVKENDVLGENRCVVLTLIWYFEERKRVQKIYRKLFHRVLKLYENREFQKF